jgi:predicted alpha/beta superfamily hydrolase
MSRFELPRPDGQGVFVISMSHPAGLVSVEAAPVMYVLDADISFGLAVEIARLRATVGEMPEPIVVGVGYGADFLTMAKLRTGDLTPPLSEAGRRDLGGMVALIGGASGGADAFLRFILDTLIPEVHRRLPQASATNRLLFGHSLGGLFTAYALLTRPDAFPAFVAGSPSLWWDGFSILSELPAFAERLEGIAAKPRVMVCVGGQEQDLPNRVPSLVQLELAELRATVARARMVDAARDFAADLLRLGVPEVDYVAFPDEDHGSVVPAALNRALSFAFRPKD